MHKSGYLALNKKWNTRFVERFYENSRYLMTATLFYRSFILRCCLVYNLSPAHKNSLGDLQQGLVKVASKVTGRSQVQLLLYLYPKYKVL